MFEIMPSMCSEVKMCSRLRAVVAIKWDLFDTSRPVIRPAWKENRRSGSRVCIEDTQIQYINCLNKHYVPFNHLLQPVMIPYGINFPFFTINTQIHLNIICDSNVPVACCPFMKSFLSYI